MAKPKLINIKMTDERRRTIEIS